MKKLFFLLGVIALVLLVAGSAMAQKYTKNPSNGKGGYDTKYGVKVTTITGTINSNPQNSLAQGAATNNDTTVAQINGNKITFVAPFTCLLDSFCMWYDAPTAASDSMMTADTMGGWRLVVKTGGSAFTAPADTAFVDSTCKRATTTALQLAAKLRANTVRYGERYAVANRMLTSGELWSVQVDTVYGHAAVTGIPKNLRFSVNLIPPDK